MLAGVLIVALAAVASAADAPVTSADLVTPGDKYPMPKGLESWASVLADVFLNKVSKLLLSFALPYMHISVWSAGGMYYETAVHWAVLCKCVRRCSEACGVRGQEGSSDKAKTALTSFQSMVSNQLAKMEKDFQAGKPFPDLQPIQDAKAFQVQGPCNFVSGIHRARQADRSSVRVGPLGARSGSVLCAQWVSNSMKTLVACTIRLCSAATLLVAACSGGACMSIRICNSLANCQMRLGYACRAACRSTPPM